MNLIDRVKSILLKPRETWPVIDAEATTPADLYKNYIVWLAAVPSIAAFIGLSLVGIGGVVSYRMPIANGLVQMVVGYVLSLVMVYVLALIVDALAPKFGGRSDRIRALKLVGYGATASFVGGVFSIFPVLGVLGLLAALYSIYLIYTGLPVLMKCPPEKALGYTAVVIACGVLASLLLGLAMVPFSPGVRPGV